MPAGLPDDFMMSGADVALPYCNLTLASSQVALNPLKKK